MFHILHSTLLQVLAKGSTFMKHNQKLDTIKSPPPDKAEEEDKEGNKGRALAIRFPVPDKILILFSRGIIVFLHFQ